MSTLPTQIQQSQLAKAVATLKLLGLPFAVLDGETKYGDLIVQMPKPKGDRKRRAPLYPIGTLTKYIMPYLNGTEIGDVAVIPIGSFDSEHIQSSACACAGRLWGNGSYKTEQNTKNKTVEVLREK